MWFNSIDFLTFFVVVYLTYRVTSHRLQNLVLLVASYTFYMSWDWRFFALIAGSTLIDYVCARGIYQSTSTKRQKLFLAVSLTANLGALGFFKYCNFFVHSFAELSTWIGLPVSTSALNIILPVGISFYTFQTMAYTIDVYRKEIEPVRSLPDFALYVSFFPQLVAGPIERAGRLLPQIQSPRTITLNHITTGGALILFGIFQKVVVADNLALLVDPVYNNPNAASRIDVLIATVSFAFQIFCDFAGYSNIARGVASLMGFELINNFLAPYCATNPQDFWRRWHISLSTWLRDYIYIPLGGSRGGKTRILRNLAITMLLGGLWHGAAWNFVLWGAYIGLLLILHRLFIDAVAETRLSPLLRNPAGWLGRWLCFFILTCFGWMLFRVNQLSDLPLLLNASGSDSLLNVSRSLSILIALLIPSMWIQVIQYRKNDPLALFKLALPIRVISYVLLFYAIVIFGVSDAQSFIYFQF